MTLDSLTQLIQFIFGLGILIVLHELGHFLVARLLHVEIEEFGIGFPPRMVKLFEAGGTEYTLNWIPLGGFVRPKGENDPSIPGGLAAASPWTRLAVLFAGPAINIALGIVLAIFFFYSLGDPILSKVRIDGIAPDSPAHQAGLQVGDIILKVNNQDIDGMEALQAAIQDSLGQPTQVIFERNGQTSSVDLVPRLNPPPTEGAIGVLLGNPTQPIGFSAAIARGFTAAVDYVRAILQLPVNLVRGESPPGEGRGFVGYKGMFDIYQQIRNPLYFFMAVSFSLGILNLFPIPALDGGRILLTLPEILLRKRIPPRYENMIHLVGFAVLLILLIYINIQDFVNPIQFP
jgi:regulator of sigma E protease